MEKYGVNALVNTPCCVCGKPSARGIGSEMFCEFCNPFDFVKSANYAKVNDRKKHNA